MAPAFCADQGHGRISDSGGPKEMHSPCPSSSVLGPLPTALEHETCQPILPLDRTGDQLTGIKRSTASFKIALGQVSKSSIGRSGAPVTVFPERRRNTTALPDASSRKPTDTAPDTAVRRNKARPDRQHIWGRFRVFYGPGPGRRECCLYGPGRHPPVFRPIHCSAWVIRTLADGAPRVTQRCSLSQWG